MKGYCDDHASQRKSWATTTARTGTATGRPWRRIRERVLIRDGYLCVMCASNNRHVQATEVDHIKRKADGGNEALSNLQSLCKHCHNNKSLSGS